MYDVFISHAHEDGEEIARPLAQALAGYGLSVWIDYDAIPYGASIILLCWRTRTNANHVILNCHIPITRSLC
jgi:hypothetical protein